MARLFLILTVLTFTQFIQAQVETVLQKGHRLHVESMAFSPNGKLLVSAGRDHSIKLWNVNSGREIRTFSNHESEILSIQFSPDGTKILSAGRDNRVIIHNVIDGKKLFDVEIEKEHVESAAFDPTGTKVLIGDNRFKAYLYAVKEQKLLGTYEKSYAFSVNSDWFSPDGTKLVCLGERDIVLYMDLVTGDTLQQMKTKLPKSLAISPDGKQVAVGSAKLFAEVFDLETGKLKHHLENSDSLQCTGCNTYVAYSPNGKYIATGSSRSGTMLWDAKTGKELKVLIRDNERVQQLFFNSDSDHLLVRRDEQCLVFNVKSHKEKINALGDEMSCHPAFSANGKLFARSGTLNSIEIWNITSGKKIKELKGFLNDPSKKELYSQKSVWNTAILRDYNIKNIAVVSPDSKHILKGRIDSIFIMLDINTGKKVKEFKGHTGEVISLAYSRDGKYIASGSVNGEVYIWDAETADTVKTFYWNKDLIFDLQFNNEGTHILVSSNSGVMSFFNIDKAQSTSYTYENTAQPYSARYTPNNLYAVRATRSGKLALVEADAAQVFREIVGHKRIVNDIAFSSDGRSMVTASRDGKAKVWDILSGMQTCRFAKHTSAVFSVDTDPQGRFVVTGGNDNDIYVWNPVTGAVIKKLEGHNAAVTSVRICPDGAKLVSCSIDGMIKVWDLDNFTEIYTYYQINRNDWFASVPSGHIDGSPAALKIVNYVSGNEVLPSGSLFEKLYTPSLIERVNSGEELNQSSSNIKDLLREAALVQLAVDAGKTRSMLHETDSIEWYEPQFPLLVELTGQGKGAEETRIYCNKKLVEVDMLEINLKKGKSLERTYSVPLSAGQNTISVVSINKERVESVPAEITVFYDGAETSANLYIVSIGINKYENPSYNLSYAVNDAKACTKNVSKGGKAIFKDIEEYFIKDEKATKQQIDSVMNIIAEKSTSADAFLFYFAGHGAMSMGSAEEPAEFFIVPNNVTQIYGNDEILKNKAISASELMDYSQKIKAGKQLFVLDACQSGGAVNTFAVRGASREKAIAQLARSTGTFFLLASGAMQFASEAKELGHGLFSYSILEALGGKADGGDTDARITVNELKSYVETRVPELTKQYMLTPQYPTGYSFGQDFPIVLIK